MEGRCCCFQLSAGTVTIDLRNTVDAIAVYCRWCHFGISGVRKLSYGGDFDTEIIAVLLATSGYSHKERNLGFCEFMVSQQWNDKFQ